MGMPRTRGSGPCAEFNILASPPDTYRTSIPKKKLLRRRKPSKPDNQKFQSSELEHDCQDLASRVQHCSWKKKF
ncbi:hypothetical protein IAQ61_004180 [Plenodomus lingam]|uniref:uncharacterized protein n=1 Tax=Leptosphaeria maculans TaxID=5022 RepID=UPI00331DEF8A|nr:hypothetical protein IAQ61_004180 [Plenodomus lingam]